MEARTLENVLGELRAYGGETITALDITKFLSIHGSDVDRV